MRKFSKHKLLTFCFSILVLTASSQKSKFEKDYSIIDSITKNLASYNILIAINDSSLSYPNTIAAEIIQTFDFLKRKKRTDTNPDFTIKILINTILPENPQYAYIREESVGTQYEGRLYRVFGRYYLKPAMEVLTKSKSEYIIAFSTNKVYETSIEYKTYNKPGQVSFMADKNWLENNIDHYLEVYTANFKKQVMIFRNDFTNIFKAYKTGRLRSYNK